MTLRHTPTAVFLTVPATLSIGLAVLTVLGAPGVDGVVRAVPLLLPLPLLWWTRLVLVPDGVDVVVLRRRHTPAAEVRAVLLERVGQRAWTTTLELADGTRRRAVALTALKLAPGITQRPQPGLLERAGRLADHLGAPLRVVLPGRSTPPPPPPPPGPSR